MDGSWLRLRTNGRYDMHELVRQYCGEKLETEHGNSTGEHAAEVRRRYCDYYAALLRIPVEDLGFKSDIIPIFEPEFGNLQAALHWASALPYVPPIHALVRSIWFAGDMLGWQRSVYGVVRAAGDSVQSHLDSPNWDDVERGALIARLAEIRMAQIAVSSQLRQLDLAAEHVRQLEALTKEMAPSAFKHYCRAEAHYRRCILGLARGDFRRGLDHGRQALACYEDSSFASLWYDRERGQIWHQADVLSAIARLSWCLGDYGEAGTSWQRSITLADEIREMRFKSQHSAQLARLLITLGQYARAEEQALACIQVSKSVGDEVWAAIAHLTYGMARHAQRDYAIAREHILIGVHMGRQSGFSYLLESLPALGRLELEEGDVAAAQSCYEEAIREFGQSGAEQSHVMVAVWLGIGWLELAKENPAQARQVFSIALASGKCATWEKMEGIAGLAEVAVHEDRVEDAVELLALVATHPFTAHAQRQHSQRRLDELAIQFDPDIFADRTLAGKTRVLDATLTEMIAVSSDAQVAA